jgi:hypothetical protein
MGALQFADIGDICERGSVKDTDVAMLRRALAVEACLKVADAEALFRIQDACPVQDPAWADFFVDTITDFLVREAEPSGYLTRGQGAWLVARISNNGAIRTKTEFDLLTNVLKKSRWAPESLVCYALGQIRDAVLAGIGPLRAGSVLKAGRITPAEVEGVRSILCAYGAEGTMALTRAEAEILFAINDAVCPVDVAMWPDDSGWSDLFMKAIASSVMAASGYAVPSREDVLQREPDFAAAAGFLGNEMAFAPAGRLPRGLFGNYRTQSPEERALERLERQRVEIITGEPVSEVHADWLAERLGGGGPVGRNEQTLFAAFKRAGTTLAPALQAVVDHHYRAA